MAKHFILLSAIFIGSSLTAMQQKATLDDLQQLLGEKTELMKREARSLSAQVLELSYNTHSDDDATLTPFAELLIRIDALTVDLQN